MKPTLRRLRLTGALLLLVATLIVDGCVTGPTGPPPPPRVRHRRNAARVDIHTAAREFAGQPPQSILRALGRPDRQFGDEHWEWWVYDDAFYDPVTQQVLESVTLAFRDGKLVDITY